MKRFFPGWALMLVGYGTISPKAAPAISLSSTTHPAAVSYTFSNPTAIPFAAYSKPGGVDSGAQFHVENGALKIENSHAGSFGVDTKIRPFDAVQIGQLFFDYKLTPEVKVNVFFRINGTYHGAIFSGPPEVRAGAVMLGKIEDVKTDGAWHRAHIPLRDWLRKLYPTAEKLPVDEVIIGNWDNTNYLMAGFGGNGPGATWWLDNFVLCGTGPAELKAQLNGDDGKPPAKLDDFWWSLDDGAETAWSENPLTITAPDGFHLLHVRQKNGEKKDGEKTEVAALGFQATSQAPTIGEAQLRDNHLQVLLAAPGGLDLKTLKLAVDGKNFDLSSPDLSWDGAAGILNLAAGEAGLGWKDGAQVPVLVDGVRDLLGRTTPARTQNLTIEYSGQTLRPPLPQLLLSGVAEKPLSGSGFEDGLDNWSGEGDGAAILERDTSTSASGLASLRLTCPANAASFRASIQRQPFDAGKYPIISFDYRVPAALRVDFLLSFAGKPYSVQFTDHDNPWTRLGKVENVIADDQWHHAEFNLGAMLHALNPTAANYQVAWLAIGDAGWLGNFRGLRYWIDNFQMVPVAGGAPLQARVALPDVTGLKALSWVVDEQAETVPPVPALPASTFIVQDMQHAAIETTLSGRRWLHVRAQNGAGQWSAPLHSPVWLDGAAPQIGAANPVTESHAAPNLMTWPLRDDLALDPASLALTVQGQNYKIGDDVLQYDSSQGRLRWDVQTALQNKTLPSLANGARVDWKLAPVRDYAGNITKEQSGGWIYDYAQDKTGPLLRVESSSHPLLVMEDFQNSDGSAWMVPSGARIERVPVAGQPDNFALRFTNPAANSEFTATAYGKTFDASKWNIVGFAYRIPETANLSLRVRLKDNRAWNIRLNGQANDSLGLVPGIVADNGWHRVQFDLTPFLKRDPKLNPAEIVGLDFVDPAKKTAAKVAWEIDDFFLAQRASGPAKLSWQGFDLGGAVKYRFDWDDKPLTMPSTETTETARTIEAKSGNWWAHLQAQDAAGNWGAVTHFPVVIP